jgi:hypothetical protein
MCHYSAFRGGRDVPRRLIAEFSEAVHPELAPGRPIPTLGLTVNQLSSLLIEFGTPPLHYEIEILGDIDRPVEWPARDQAADAVLMRMCCRYLNSGLPIIAIVLQGPINAAFSARHALVICGYTRPDDDSPSVSLIFNDDRRGPYLTVKDPLNDIDEAANEQYRWEHVLVPLPTKVWVSGEVAERFGCTRLTEAANKAVTIHDLPGARQFLEAQAERLTVRTYATTANRFKERLQERCSDPVILRNYLVC